MLKPRQQPDLPARLETERLILRPYQPSDGPAYFEVCKRNRDHLLPFEAGNPAVYIYAVDEAVNLMKQFANDWQARSHFFLCAWEKASGAFVAQVFIGPVNWELPEFEIGYFVDQAHEGQGYVTEAVRAALRFIFDDLGAWRVRLSCDETNVRSWRVAERCGFTREGHLRQTKRHILRDDGKPSGDYLYGLLREEWEQRQSG